MRFQTFYILGIRIAGTSERADVYTVHSPATAPEPKLGLFPRAQVAGAQQHGRYLRSCTFVHLFSDRCAPKVDRRTVTFGPGVEEV